MGNACCSDSRSKEGLHLSDRIVPAKDKYYAEHAPKISVAQLLTLSDMDGKLKIILEIGDKHLPHEVLAFIRRMKDKSADNEFIMGPFHYNQTNEKYLGNYRHGERQGLGITAYSDGSVYCGNYLNDQTNGQGILIIQADNKTNVFTGEFNKNGKQIHKPF